MWTKGEGNYLVVSKSRVRNNISFVGIDGQQKFLSGLDIYRLVNFGLISSAKGLRTAER